MDKGDDQVIDLSTYLKRREEPSSRARSSFALWGGDGERSRFALPLWRSAYLAGGRRAAVLFQSQGSEGGAPVEPLVVLDLGEDPARIDFGVEALTGVAGAEKPGTAVASGPWVSVYLGQDQERTWYLVVGDLEEPVTEVRGRTRDDLLFLAGECAGLLFHKQLHREPGPG